MTAAAATRLTAETAKANLYRILSLDGGGAKGFYTLGGAPGNRSSDQLSAL